MKGLSYLLVSNMKQNFIKSLKVFLIPLSIKNDIYYIDIKIK